MMRRLILAATCLAIMAGGAGAASASSNGDGSTTSMDKKAHQLCVLFYTDHGPVPDHICVNW